MKLNYSLLAVAASVFVLSGCYTQLEYSRYKSSGVSAEGGGQAEIERRIVGTYPFYYKDYSVADWYTRHRFGLDAWNYPYYGYPSYGWWDTHRIGSPLRYDWYRYGYSPSVAYWSDYIYYNGFVYRRYRYLDDYDIETDQRYAPRLIGTSRLNSLQTGSLPVRSGTFGLGVSSEEDVSVRSRTVDTGSRTTERESPSRLRGTGSGIDRTRSTGRSTVSSTPSSSGSSRNADSSGSGGSTRNRTGSRETD